MGLLIESVRSCGNALMGDPPSKVPEDLSADELEFRTMPVERTVHALSTLVARCDSLVCEYVNM